MTCFLSSRSEARDLVTLFGMYFHSNPAKPEPKFHRMEDMLALRAKTEARWVLAGALVLSGFLFFRYLEGYVISTGGRDLVHLEFFKPEDFGPLSNRHLPDRHLPGQRSSISYKQASHRRGSPRSAVGWNRCAAPYSTWIIGGIRFAIPPYLWRLFYPWGVMSPQHDRSLFFGISAHGRAGSTASPLTERFA